MAQIIDEKLIRKGLDDLANLDPDVAVGLDLVGYPPPRIRPHDFSTLLHIIVSQQISTKATASILSRLLDAMGENTASALMDMSIDQIHACGMSRRKAEYALGVAQAIISGALDMDSLPQMTDDMLLKELVKLRGIGQWSGEIYAIFSLGRTDIFPADDIALQEALKRLKRLNERPNGKAIRPMVEHWSPWRSVGALFLWRYYRGAPS